MPRQMFMWRWQHRFQDAIASLLTSIFQILELPLVSKTFIIGISINSNQKSQICFQGEDCQFSPDQFKDVFAIALTLLLLRVFCSSWRKSLLLVCLILKAIATSERKAPRLIRHIIYFRLVIRFVFDTSRS